MTGHKNIGIGYTAFDKNYKFVPIKKPLFSRLQKNVIILLLAVVLILLIVIIFNPSSQAGFVIGAIIGAFAGIIILKEYW